MLSNNVYQFMREQKFENLPTDKIENLLSRFDNDYVTTCRKHRSNESSKGHTINRLYLSYSIGIHRTSFSADEEENKNLQKQIAQIFEAFAKKYYLWK